MKIVQPIRRTSKIDLARHHQHCFVHFKTLLRWETGSGDKRCFVFLKVLMPLNLCGKFISRRLVIINQQLAFAKYKTEVLTSGIPDVFII